MQSVNNNHLFIKIVIIICEYFIPLCTVQQVCSADGVWLPPRIVECADDSVAAIEIQVIRFFLLIEDYQFVCQFTKYMYFKDRPQWLRLTLSSYCCILL